jgi:SAM-dependent methyltransferase
VTIQGREGIRDAYRDEQVARQYVQSRFREPLGALLHRRQVEHLGDVMRRVRPAAVLEIAPGPARVTVDIAAVLPNPAVLVDASAQMLAEARSSLRAAGHGRWHRLVQADAFALPLAQCFDLVYTFRLIRHFDDRDRQRLYRQIARVLRPGGVLVFDAVNAEVAEDVRAKSDGCHHYDALLTAAQLSRELEEAGFRSITLTGVQHHYPLLYRLQVLIAPRSRRLAAAGMRLVDRFPAGAPLEWIVTCERP